MLRVFSQAVVHCEHVLAELARQRERLEKELALEQEKIVQARDAARSESKREKEELAQMVSTFSRMDYSRKCRPANLHTFFVVVVFCIGPPNLNTGVPLAFQSPN